MAGPPDKSLTVPQPVEARPLHTLSVEVASGPDRGKRLAVDDERLAVGSATDNELVLTDDTVSRYHCDLRRAPGGIAVEDHGSTNGTWVGPVRVERAVVPPGTTLTVGRTQLTLSDGQIRPVQPPSPRTSLHGLVGATPAMRELMDKIERVGSSDASVLLLGETGTGKEVIARAVHLASGRAKAPFEIVDCGSLMPTLVASELFGHEKGAFTGAAARHVGAFERAAGGTVFLDEIGELPANLQVQLLGVLERKAFRRLGGTSYIPTDVRIVAATHRDLRRWVNSGEFRQDLYYRLAVARLEIPSLRERVDDIPLLVESFLLRMGVTGPVTEHFPGVALDVMKRYHWPGNVRELRNYIEAALAFGEPPPMGETAASDEDRLPTDPGPASSDPFDGLYELSYARARDEVVARFQRAYFEKILERAKQNVSQAARLAEMNRPHLVTVLQKLGLR